MNAISSKAGIALALGICSLGNAQPPAPIANPTDFVQPESAQYAELDALDRSIVVHRAMNTSTREMAANPNPAPSIEYYYRPIYAFAERTGGPLGDELKPNIVFAVSRDSGNVRAVFKVMLKSKEIEPIIRALITETRCSNGETASLKQVDYNIQHFPVKKVVLAIMDNASQKVYGMGTVEDVASAPESGVMIPVDFSAATWELFKKAHNDGEANAKFFCIYYNRNNTVGVSTTNFSAKIADKIGEAYTHGTLREGAFMSHQEVESIAHDICIDIRQAIYVEDKQTFADMASFAKDRIIKAFFDGDALTKWQEISKDSSVAQKMIEYLAPKVRKIREELTNDDSIKKNVDIEKTETSSQNGKVGIVISFLPGVDLSAQRQTSDRILDKVETITNVKFNRVCDGEFYVVTQADVYRLRSGWKNITGSETAVVAFNGSIQDGCVSEAPFFTTFTVTRMREALSGAKRQHDALMQGIIDIQARLNQALSDNLQMKAGLISYQKKADQLAAKVSKFEADELERIRQANEKAAQIAAANAEGNVFRIPDGDGTVWRVRQGKRCGYTSPQALEQDMHYGVYDSRILKNPYGSLLPQGPDINYIPPARGPHPFGGGGRRGGL